MEYGLIGKTLKHSFSPEIHARLADYSYVLVPLEEQELQPFILAKDFKGINVTIPYKEKVLPFCDVVDPVAKKIGAVNTILNKKGRLHGYNTDCEGFIYLLRRHGIELKGRTVLLLGNGASTKTVTAAAELLLAAEILVASRAAGDDVLSYGQAMQRQDVQVVVNCSPAGMYPNNGTSLIDLAAFPKLEAVVDLVYNPMKTSMLLQAEALGVPAVNGLEMLVAQAKYAAEYFMGRKIKDNLIQQIRRDLGKQLVNLCLVGMPGSGKTSLGKKVAKMLGKEFVDLDKEIVTAAGMPIPKIFEQQGEEAFRALESQVTAEVTKRTGLVIATGGGIVKRPENIQALRQNGVVMYINCPLEELAFGKGRPLSQSREDLEKLYAERSELYKAAADIVYKRRSSFKENPKRMVNEYEKLMNGSWFSTKKRESKTNGGK